MTRVSALKTIPRKKKIVRQTRSEQYLVNLRYLGSEIEYEDGHELTDSELMDSLNWYSQMETPEEAKEYIIEWLENNEDDRLKSFRKTKRFSQTAGWLARLLTRGYQIPVNSYKRMNAWIDEACQRADNDNEESATIIPITSRKQNELLIKVQDQLDEIIFNRKYKESGFSLYVLLTSIPHTKKDLEQVKAYLNPLIEEYKELATSRDPQFLEGYRHYTRTQKKEAKAFFENIEEDIKRFEGIVRVSKPRKKKKPSADKLVQKFRYKKEDTELQMKSIDPRKIIDSQEVWTYNHKYKMLTIYYAKAGSKLTVRDSFIENYDEERSFCKPLGRKFKEVLDKILFSTKAVLNKVSVELFDNTRKLSNRSTPDVIIMKAF